MGDYLINVHDSYRMVVAICDSELYGRKLVEDERQLDLTGNFFNGESMGEEEARKVILKCLGEDATFNIIGSKSVDLMKGLGLVLDDGVLEVDGIPFALVLL